MRHLGFLCGAVVLGACFDPNAVGDDGTGATTIATDDPTTTMPASSNASGSTAMIESTSDEGTSSSDGSLDDSSSSTGTSSSSSDDTAGTEANTCVVDGMLGEAEQCDDGNEAAGDGCSDCVVEDGFGCTGEPSLCGPACDPLLQDCADGEGCYPHDPVFACAPAGSGSQQDPCDTVNGCLPGLVCITADVVPGCASPGGNCCSTICDTPDPVCPGGFGCVSYYPLGTAPEGLEDVGVCAG